MSNKCILIILIVVTSMSSFTQNKPSLIYYTPDNILSFANYLYDEGEYLSAANEYKRFEFLFRSDKDSIKIRIADCYLRARKYDLAKDYLRLSLQLNKTDSLNSLFTYLLGCSHFLSGEYDSCVALIEPYSKVEIPLVLRNKLLFLLTSSYIIRDNWESAKSIISSQNNLYPWKELEEYITVGSGLRNKSPLMAATLSTLVPGLGKIYVGKTVDGIFSFIAVAITGWQAYDGFNRNGTRSVKGWILGALSFTLYTGGIYGSAVAAEFQNREISNIFKNNVQTTFKIVVGY